MSHVNPGIRLLLVDDEQEFLEAIEPGLVHRGFEVTTARDGRSALNLLSSHSFDVVVLDVKMPGIDGIDTFREIKRAAPTLPVIILTGHGHIDQAFEAVKEGIYEYLTKPCDVRDLARTARRAAGSSPGQAGSEQIYGKDVRLLLVDDDLEFLASLAPSLERRGVQVVECHTGEDAIAKASERIFDVALVDVVMPGMDGLTLLSRLKEVDPLLEVIILTGNPRLDDMHHALKTGAQDYLIKPQSVEDLLRVIRSAFHRRVIAEEENREEEINRILAERPD
jgi:DNA-binding NtrC family response regulator